MVEERDMKTRSLMERIGASLKEHKYNMAQELVGEVEPILSPLGFVYQEFDWKDDAYLSEDTCLNIYFDNDEFSETCVERITLSCWADGDTNLYYVIENDDNNGEVEWDYDASDIKLINLPKLIEKIRKEYKEDLENEDA